MHLIRLLLVISSVSITLANNSLTFLAIANEMCKHLSNVNENVIKQLFLGTIPSPSSPSSPSSSSPASKEVMDYVFCMCRGLGMQDEFGTISYRKLKKFLLKLKVFGKPWLDRTLNKCVQHEFDGRRNAFDTFGCLREEYFKQKLFKQKPYLFYLLSE